MKEVKKLKIEAPASSAAGMKAVIIALKNIFAVMPKLKALKVLNRLNKKQGGRSRGRR